MEDAPKQLKIQKSECPDTWIKGVHGGEKYRLILNVYIFSPFLPLVLMLCASCEAVIVPSHVTNMTHCGHSFLNFL